MRWWLGCLLLAPLACDAGGPVEPEGTTVTLSLANPTGVERPTSLRVAVIWRTGESSGDSWILTADEGLTDDESSHRIRVDLPQGVSLTDSPDRVTIMLDSPDSSEEGWVAACSELAVATWPGIRPLWVVYQDLNDNQRLDNADVDRIWGVSNSADEQLVAFEDYERALAGVSLEASECLRQATGGAFSPFVSGQLSGAYFYAASAPASEFTVSLNPSAAPGTVLRCGSVPAAPFEQSPEIVSIAPDLMPDLCTSDGETCTRVADNNDWQGSTQSYSLSGEYRWAGCVTAGALQTLWVRDVWLECDECSCVQYLQDRAWVVTSDALPSEWPCGESVEVCSVLSELSAAIPDECLTSW